MTTIKTTALGTHFGPYRIDTANGEIVQIRGHEHDPDPSPIGQALIEQRHCRVARPSIRRSWLIGGPGTAPERRGQDPFIEVEWAEALDLVAAELKRIRDTFGHQAVFGGSYGWASSGRFHMSYYQIQRFLRLYGGYTDAQGTYSNSAAVIITPYILGMGYYSAYSRQTSWSVIAAHTDLMVTFGGLRLTNTQVTYGGQGTHHTRDWMQRARDRGMDFLNISPLRDDLHNALSPRWQPIRPGTDVALMLGLIHTLIISGRADEAFLTHYCEGWDVLQAYVLGTTDGVPKEASWAAEITGVDRGIIEALAFEMADRRTLINLSLSVQRADHGEQTYWMAVALACVLGQIGLPGGGIAFPFGTAGDVGASQARKRVPGLPIPLRPPECPVISVSRVTELLENPGCETDFDGRRSTYPHIRLIYWAGGNPFHHHQDLRRLDRAWQRPDTVIVHEPFWTPIAKRADVVFPATTPLERNDLGGAENLLIAMTQAVEAHAEARDDYWIFAELAHRLEFGSAFTEGRSADEWVATLYEQFRTQNNYAPPYNDFQKTGHLVHPEITPMGAREQVFLADFRSDPKSNPLGTPSGRIELFSNTIAGYRYDDCPGHPVWLEPFERLGGAGSDRWPLHLVSNQPATRLHSQYDHATPSQNTKVAGREPVRLHPDTAAARGIAEGDVVRIFNDRGACLAGAVLDYALMPEVIQLSTGAWYDPDDTGMCRSGNPNILTRDKGTSKLAQGPSAHTCLVEVERFKGKPPRVEAYDPPQFVERPESATQT